MFKCMNKKVGYGAAQTNNCQNYYENHHTIIVTPVTVDRNLKVRFSDICFRAAKRQCCDLTLLVEQEETMTSKRFVKTFSALLLGSALSFTMALPANAERLRDPSPNVGAELSEEFNESLMISILSDLDNLDVGETITLTLKIENNQETAVNNANFDLMSNDFVFKDDWSIAPQFHPGNFDGGSWNKYYRWVLSIPAFSSVTIVGSATRQSVDNSSIFASLFGWENSDSQQVIRGRINFSKANSTLSNSELQNSHTDNGNHFGNRNRQADATEDTDESTDAESTEWTRRPRGNNGNGNAWGNVNRPNNRPQPRDGEQFYNVSPEDGSFVPGDSLSYGDTYDLGNYYHGPSGKITPIPAEAESVVAESTGVPLDVVVVIVFIALGVGGIGTYFLIYPKELKKTFKGDNVEEIDPRVDDFAVQSIVNFNEGSNSTPEVLVSESTEEVVPEVVEVKEEAKTVIEEPKE